MKIQRPLYTYLDTESSYDEYEEKEEYSLNDYCHKEFFLR